MGGTIMGTVQSPAATTGGRRLLQNQYYLYLTEFFAGMAVMAVEIGASA